VELRDLDPFIHMDQMGEVDYAPGEPKGTAWHPHRGFETVTYIIDGTFRHQDSTGGGGLITNGDTQWMTAGGGLLHIEEPPEELVMSGGLFHGRSERLEQRIAAEVPTALLTRLEAPPVVGAVLMALEQRGSRPTSEVHDRIGRSLVTAFR